MNLFALDASAPWWEVWRLWTAHLVHYGAAHLALNAVAALPPLVLLRGRRITWLAAAAPLISLGILVLERPDEYRGASALVVALWVYGGLTVRTGMAKMMLVVVVMKLVVESIHPIATIGVDTSVVAHWLGATAGLVVVIPIVARDPGGRSTSMQPPIHPGPSLRSG